MRQFDLYENPSDRNRQPAPYFVVLQSHHLEELDSVVVAPLLRGTTRRLSGLDVELRIDGEVLIAALGEIFSIERALLRRAKGSIAEHEDAIRRALDRLFTGF